MGLSLKSTSREVIALHLRQCLEGTLDKYPPGYIQTLVVADHVPPVFRNEVCDILWQHPQLAGVTKEEFLEIVRGVNREGKKIK